MAIAPIPSLRFEPVPEPKKTITIGHIVINGVRLKVTLENVPNKSLSEAELKETLEKAHLIAASILGESDKVKDLKKLTVNNSGYNLNGNQHNGEKEILAKDVYTQKFKDSFYEIKEKKQFERNYSFYDNYTNKGLYRLQDQETVKISHLYQSIIQKFNEKPLIDESKIEEKQGDSTPSISPISKSKKTVLGSSLGLRFNASLQDPLVLKPDHSERDRRGSFEIDELEEASPEPSVSSSIEDSDRMIKIPQSGGRLNARAVLPQATDGILNLELDSEDDEFYDAHHVQPNGHTSSSIIKNNDPDSLVLESDNKPGLDSEDDEFFDALDEQPNGHTSSSIIKNNDPDSLVLESDNKPGMDSFVEVRLAETPLGRSRSSSLIGSGGFIQESRQRSRSPSFSVLSKSSLLNEESRRSDEEFSALVLEPECDGEVEKFEKAARSILGASSKSRFFSNTWSKVKNLISKPKVPLTAEQKDKKDNSMEVDVSN